MFFSKNILNLLSFIFNEISLLGFLRLRIKDERSGISFYAFTHPSAERRNSGSVSANASCAGLIGERVVVSLAGSLAKALVADLIAEASAVVGACAFFGAAMGEEDVEGKKKATGGQRKKSSL